MNNETLLKNLRCIPDFPVKGINFRDVTTLFKNNECLNIMLEELYEIYKDRGITKIVGIESRGFVMASALALKEVAGLRYIKCNLAPLSNSTPCFNTSNKQRFFLFISLLI